jgi:histidine phosphotransferase ChpT
MEPKPDITALIGSRICHDLISPLGAIGNGVELLAMTSHAAGPELALISESVIHANARIRFFRVAYGSVGAEQRMSARETISILDDLARGTRLNIDWQIEGDLARRDVKLAFLMIQCLETAMPWGGNVIVTEYDGHWHVSGSAERMKHDKSLWSSMADFATPPDIHAAHVQFALVPNELRQCGRRLTLHCQENDIHMSF